MSATLPAAPAAPQAAAEPVVAKEEPCMQCGREARAVGFNMLPGLIGKVCQERNRAALVAQLSDAGARRDRLPWVLDPRYGLPQPGRRKVTPEEVLHDIQRQVRREERQQVQA